METDLWTRLVRGEKDEDEHCYLWEQRCAQRQAELPRPACCEIGRRCVSASNSFEPGMAPIWQIMTWQYGARDWSRPAQVHFCPGCGERLPQLRKKSTPPPHLMSTTDGDYCNECGERGQSCPCSFPVAAWEITPMADPKFNPENGAEPGLHRGSGSSPAWCTSAAARARRGSDHDE